MMANSLDLDPEWGAIDLLEEIEASFGIRIADAEAERCCTVGDVYAIVSAHTPEWDHQDGRCGSSMVFYRIRRALSAGDERGVKPDTLLTTSKLPPRRLFETLGKDTGVRLPACELTRLGVSGGFLLLGGFVATVVALLEGHWLGSGIALLFALGGVALLWRDPGRFPAGVATIGELARRTAPLNVARLKEAGGRPADHWSILVALAAEHGTLPPRDIGPETFLHRRSLVSATAR
jgi:hypothetical protein